MVVVARALRRNETPPDSSLCVLQYEGERYLKRVHFGVGSIYLEDGTGRQEFQQEEVLFEGVALHACSCNLLGTQCVPIPLNTDGVPDILI